MATTALGFDNFYTSTLSAGITASDTTVYLNALPTATEGYLVIEPDSSTQREIIYYTSKGANFVTLPSAAAGRGVGATTAQSHSSGVTAQMNVVAEHFEALQDGTSISNTAITAAKIANIATNTTAISNPYKFRVRRSTAQTTVINWGKINLATEDFDTNNNFDSTTNFRYTAPVSGFYFFNGRASTSGGGTDVVLALYKNGTAIARGGHVSGVNNPNPGVTVTALIQVTAADYFELFIFTSSAVALEVGSVDSQPRLEGFLVSQT